MADEPKKSSQVLLDMEQNLSKFREEFAAYQKNIDFLLKTILAKLNSAPIETPPVISPVPKVPLTIKNDTVEEKVVVHQKVFYPDSRPTPLADVKIYQNGQQITKTKTNAQGKWTVKLSPGDYQVHILKVPVDNKPKIDAFFPIKVVSTQQMEIPYQPSLSK